MKKIIGRKEYDTENATLMKKYTYGCFGDPEGYEELLFLTPDEFYFLFVRGGESSPYPNEDIRRLSKDKAKQWLENHP